MSRNKKVVFTPRMIQEIKTEAICQTFLLAATYLMDEMEYSEDRILELWDGISRYADAVRNGTISMNKVCKILEEHTGMKVRWNK